MTSSTVENIIVRELRVDEELLWAHVVSPDAELDIPPAANLTMNVIFRLIWIAVTAHGIWQLSNITPEQVEQLIKIYVPLIGAILIAQWFFKKTNVGQKVERQVKRRIYQNAIITDKRILLFNHGSDERNNFTRETIYASQMDYENGGLALRITPRGNDKPSIFIGAADFRTALHIIKSNFLKSGLTP